MLKRVEISWVSRSERIDPHERITHVAGAHSNGPRWKIRQERAIAGIEANVWDFFVRCDGREEKVVVARSSYGAKYLKTEADGEQPMNLLRLPECP